MNRIERDVRTCTIIDIHERFIMNGYANIELPKQVDNAKQKLLIESILHNVPMPPIVLVCYYDTKEFNLSYHVVQGKERIEMILDFIVKNEKPGQVRYDIEGFTEQQKREFWHYHIAMHYIATELTEEERLEIEELYKAI